MVEWEGQVSEVHLVAEWVEAHRRVMEEDHLVAEWEEEDLVVHLVGQWEEWVEGRLRVTEVVHQGVASEDRQAVEWEAHQAVEWEAHQGTAAASQGTISKGTHLQPRRVRCS